MKFGKGLLFTALLGLALVLASCETTGNKEGEVIETGPTGGERIDATGFLKTDHAGLTNWLDERFEVDYKHMTPQLIFDQIPLNDIFYETVNLPSGAPTFNFSSSDVSRRELLKKISQHWKLKMTLVTNADGTPTAVRVEG